LISGLCLHYYLVYIDGSGNDAKAMNCIQLNARWMQREFDLISNHTLQEIMIPGTHDATSYEHYRASDYETNGIPMNWSHFCSVLTLFVICGSVITRFQYTQDENLYAMLAYGIRYLDMRVGAYNLTDDFYQARQSNGNMMREGNQSTPSSPLF